MHGTFRVNPFPGSELIAAAFNDSIRSGGLDRFRWYGDKQRPITGLATDALVTDKHDGALVGICIGRLLYQDGGTERYLLPFASTTEPVDARFRLAAVQSGNSSYALIDGPQSDAFRKWLIRCLLSSASLETDTGSFQFTWESSTTPDEIAAWLSSGETRVASAEQSNSSIIYGTRAIVKLYRRLVDGLNPELEIARHLARTSESSPLPALYGSAQFRGIQGELFAVAIAQEHVGANRDLWTELCETLETDPPASLDLVTVLGRSTADMHIALAQPTWDEAFATELIEERDVLDWKLALETSLARTIEALSAARPWLSDNDRQLVDLVIATRDTLAGQSEGFEPLIGRRKARVHGDYHLGQVLLTSDGIMKIIDFEGEPKRSIEERRAKTSPIKDVAGMLRSLSYARGAAQLKQAQRVTDAPLAVAQLVEWERAARQRFLAGYLDRINGQNPSLVPDSSDDMRRATRAWELDKALYETRYELSSRPEWIWLPLSSLVQRV